MHTPPHTSQIESTVTDVNPRIPVLICIDVEPDKRQHLPNQVLVIEESLFPSN